MIKISGRYDKLYALLLYIVLIAVAYGPVLFAFRSLAPPLLQPHGVVAGWPEGYAGRTPVNLFNIDMATPAYYEWPTNKFVGDSYRNKELPLWNRFQGAGTPLAAQYSTRAFFPYQILENISPVKYWDFFLLGRLLIAGFFTFVFLSLLRLPFAPAFLSGALYMFSGSFTWFINLEQFANNAMMLPLLMWAVERLVTKRSSWNVPLAAVMFALTALAGQPEMALYILFLATLYFILRTLMLIKEVRVQRSIKRFALASLLSIALAAPLLLPFGELMQNSHNIHPPGGDMGVRSVKQIRMPASIITPTIHEFPQDPTFMPSVPLALEHTPGGEEYFFRIFPTNGVWDFLGGYTGIVMPYLLFAGLFSLPFARKNRLWPLLLFFTGFGTLILLKNFGIEPFVQLGRLPLFDQVWSQRWAGPTWTFSFAVGAGLALETIRNAFGSKKEQEQLAEDEAAVQHYGPEIETKKKKGTAIPAFLIPLAALGASFTILMHLLPTTVLLLFIKFVRTNEFFQTFGPSFILGSFLSLLFLIIATIVLITYTRKGRGLDALIPLALIELWWALPRGYSTDWLYLKLIPLIIGLYVVLQFFKGRRKSAVLTVLLLFASIMLLDHYSPRGLPDRYDPFTPAPYIGFLKERAPDERVIAGYGLLFPNFSSALEIKDIRYINSLAIDTFQDYRNSYLHALHPIENESSSLWFTGRPELFVREGGGNTLYNRGIEKDFIARLPYYSLLSVKYIILPAKIDINEVALRAGRIDGKTPVEFPSVYSDKEVSIYENPTALPHAYIVSKVKRVENFKEAQRIAGTGDFASGIAAVIEKEAPVTFLPGVSNTATEDTKERTIADETQGRVKDQKGSIAPGSESITDTQDSLASLVEPLFKDKPDSTEATVKKEEVKSAKIVAESNNGVTVEAKGPGLLVLTDTYYPGWSVKVDGESAEIYRVNGVVRGVFISSGAHVVDFMYLPKSFLSGVILAGVSLISCLWYGFRCEKKEETGVTEDEKEAV